MRSRNQLLIGTLIRVNTTTLIARIRSYCTNGGKKASLYSKISPLGNPTTSITPELDEWVRQGNKLRFAELQRITLDLRKHKRFSQALEVLEWMKRNDAIRFTTTEHAMRLDLIGKVHGFLSAEEYDTHPREWVVYSRRRGNQHKKEMQDVWAAIQANQTTNAQMGGEA